ncbi:MAG: ATP phosphoribosyltransferase [Thermoplasmata archaeon]|jgi:ATP phosphoribosyltransferase|nr:ATP phosphoribosyltransferase [Thermoplasmata archaeon]
MTMVRIALPNKGRLNQSAIRLMNRIGFPVPEGSNRTLLAEFGKGRYQVLLARAQDIPEFVEMGAADLGITGLDLVMETSRKVENLMELDFGRCRLVVAVPEESKVETAEDVKDGSTVATCFPNLTKAFFSKLGKNVDVAEVSGATEVAPQVGLADVITDLTETGSTLKLNHLKEIGVILESKAVVIANAKSMTDKKARIEEVTSAIQSVMNASRKRYIMANVPRASLPNLKTLLPGVSGPTVMNIMGREDMVAIHAVTNEDEINGVITMLKSIGAAGILVIPIERMVL